MVKKPMRIDEWVVSYGQGRRRKAWSVMRRRKEGHTAEARARSTALGRRRKMSWRSSSGVRKIGVFGGGAGCGGAIGRADGGVGDLLFLFLRIIQGYTFLGMNITLFIENYSLWDTICMGVNKPKMAPLL